MLTIRTIVDDMSLCLLYGSPQDYPKPCSAKDIKLLENLFVSQFGMTFLKAYKTILRQSNGISYNTLVIWPLEYPSSSQETIFEVNHKFQETISRDYIFFARFDNKLFGYKVSEDVFCSIDAIEKDQPCQVFEDSEKMFLHLLKQAWQ